MNTRIGESTSVKWRTPISFTVLKPMPPIRTILPEHRSGSIFLHYLPGYSEGTVYLAQFVLLITPLLVLFEKINLRQWLWIPAILALLALALANFGHGIVSLYTDHILSVWYAGVMLQALNSDKTRLLEIGLLSLPLSVILLIKDAGLPLVVSAVFLMICLLFYRNFREKKNFALNRTIHHYHYFSGDDTSHGARGLEAQ